MVLRGVHPQPPTNPTEEPEDSGGYEDCDLGPASGPKVLSSIELAKTPGMFLVGPANSLT